MGVEVLLVPSIVEERMKASVVPQKPPLLYERSYIEDIVLLLRYLRNKLARVHRRRRRRCGSLRTSFPIRWSHFTSLGNLIEHVVGMTSFTL